MAEGLPEAAIHKSQGTEKQDKGENLECAVCLQPCVFPAQLPCGHIFCFLCIKGIANQSKKCAMCRHEIPRDFLEHPNLLKRPCTTTEEPESGEVAYQWFYEGRNGWWQYDERTSKELEACYKSGERTCELLIAGFLYVTDLEAMVQLRRNDPTRRRRIKRDLSTIPKKGIAGLRTETEEYNNVDFQRSSVVEGRYDALTPTTPTNTPQSPPSGRQSPSASDLETTINRIQLLAISNSNDVVDNQLNETSFVTNGSDNNYRCRNSNSRRY